jgi:hypothetical protein
MNELESALRDLRACVSSGDSDAAEVLMFGPLDDIAMLEEPWSDELFDGVAGLLRDEQFLHLEASWKLAELFVRHWHNLAPRQPDQFRGLLATCFDKFQNWMGAFLVADMLGERYADEGALNSLDALSRQARLPHRALAAYGLGKLARTVGNGSSVHGRAIARLKALRSDEAEQVRAESIAALRKLGEP